MSATATNLGKVACTPKGQWVYENEYAILDIVTNAGSSYIAIKTVPANTDITDTDYWAVLAEKGDKGDTGEITEVTASVDGGIGTPNVVVTEGGTTTEKTLDFAFHNLKGNGIVSIVSEKTGTVGNVDTYTITITYENESTDTLTYTVTNGSVTSVNGMTGDVVVRNVEHADVADNLSPYSEDSGAIQDTPFISQGTGTGNNSVIVTTGDQAKQLEKLGNAVVYNQYIRNPFFDNADRWNEVNSTLSIADHIATFTALAQSGGMSQVQIPAVAGHKILVIANIKLTTATDQVYIDVRSGASTKIYTEATTNWQTLCAIRTANPNSSGVIYCSIFDGRETGWDAVQVSKVHIIDLDLWFNGNIPQDLLDNPSHFSWYYNGSLTYNAGEIKHGEGVKLVCTRGRNLFNEDAYTTQKNYIDLSKLAPNVAYYIRAENTSGIIQYKIASASSGTPVWISATMSGVSFTLTNEMRNVGKLFIINSSYSACTPAQIKTAKIDLTPYYTPAEGGEGYDQYYPYEEPDIIDTGSEPLGAFDKKTPDGVIHRKSYNLVLDGTTTGAKITTVSQNAETGLYYGTLTIPSQGVPSTSTHKTVVCDKFVNGYSFGLGVCYITSSGNTLLFVNTDQTLQTVADWNTWLTTHNVTVEYELATETTEQGSSFRQYANINDYGIMYWLDENDELVSIPQGCKIQYPVNYKGYVDDLYMYTNGDATAIALKDDITDAALEARGYLKLTALSGYDATKTQTLKNVQGVFTWVDDQ